MVSAIARRLDPDPDRRFVTRARDGDLGAFELLVTRHRDVVYRVAARVLGEDEAEDATQDALLRAFHRLDDFRGEGSFRAWLLQIAHSSALAAASRRAGESVPLSDVEDAPAGGQRTPADEIEAGERRHRLGVKVRGLSPQHRTVLVLRDIEGFSYEEIATVTQAPIGSVKARLHRARGELVDSLRRNTYDWDLPGG